MKLLRKLVLLSFFIFFQLFLTGCENVTNYTITFETNGGSTTEAIVNHAGAFIQGPTDPLKAGFSFDGWYTESDLINPYTFHVMPSENITLYAKWIDAIYTVNFVDYDHAILKTDLVPYGEDATAPNSPTREGYIFSSWSQDFTHVQSNLTIIAQYTVDSTYDLGTVDKNTLQVNVSQDMQDAVDAFYDYYNESYTFYLLPSKGTVNILVIPIEFTNDKFTTNEKSIIQEGFFGDGDQFETLKSYYEKSSYDQLTFTGEVLPVYSAPNTYQYYNNYTTTKNPDATGVDLLIEGAIHYYESTMPSLDLSRYDSDGDSFIDAVHLVYSAPIDYVSDDTIYWAYQYYYNATAGTDDSDYVSWGDYEFDSYVFSGVGFFTEGGIKNAWTIIHETGHLMGLEDYYDYSSSDSNKGGLGGADMMDDTQGDHNPFSKLMLDWIDPYVVSQTCTVTINPFETSGDAIIIADPFTSIFDEYFVLDFYTPTNLNAGDGYITDSGLIMYHVDSTLPTFYDNMSDYSYYFLNNNSDSNHKLIKIEEADGNNSISYYESNAGNSDLLKVGNSYTLKLYNNQTICTVHVDSKSTTEMTLTFTFNS